MEKWTVSKSADLYNVRTWGSGYFDVNAAGHVTVSPHRSGTPQVDLFELVRSLVKRGIQLPILLRFDGIIHDRIRGIQEAFQNAINEFNYQGIYRLAYPIKVNQQRQVVDAIRHDCHAFGVGLEVGSKPELLAVLAIHDAPDGLLLCNGYKDEQYIELALLARKLGRRSIIIIEQFSELDVVFRVSAELGIEPEIGLRMKPTSRGSGRWEASAGENGKFGLHSYEIVKALELLKERGKLDWLKLLHFHVGSQITSITAIKRVLKEAARMYTELAQLCPSLSFLDVGGGLAVDYDGSQTNFESSMNYSIEEYARDVIWTVQTVCDEYNIKHPDILSESGRAVVAHHSVLVTEVLDASLVESPVANLGSPPTENETLQELAHMYNELNTRNCRESIHDALSLREEVLQRFTQGDFNLVERAFADKALRQFMTKANSLARGLKFIPEELEKIDEKLVDTYFCNFSVFQSVPDCWAIDQLFPIMPIHRLDQEPSRRVIIGDLTCDSDGKIDLFIDPKDVKKYLRLHEYSPDEEYYLGMFLVGAYQEILGDLHNLFGDTNAVHVDFNENGEAEIVSVIEGNTVRDVLSFVQFEPQDLLERLRNAVERSLRNGTLTPEESAKLQKRFREGLDGYTYLLS